MLLFGGATTVVGVQNFHPAISGLHLTNSNPEVGELAVRMTAGRIAALVVGRVGPSFWICREKKGVSNATAIQKINAPRRQLRSQRKSIRTFNPILRTKSMDGPENVRNGAKMSITEQEGRVARRRHS